MSFVEPRYDPEASEEDDSDVVDWDVPDHARILPIALVLVMGAAWFGHVLKDASEGFERFGMLDWAVSASALGEGRYETIVLHMFAHGGAMHIVMNATALIALGPPLVARLGAAPLGWLRFLALFLLSGLAGMAVYLAIHPAGTVPMLGASGAICGLVGLLARFQKGSSELVPIRSSQTWQTVKSFVKDNAILFALLTLPALLSGRGGGVAWEAHLGGLLFGLLAGPAFLPKSLGAVEPDPGSPT